MGLPTVRILTAAAAALTLAAPAAHASHTGYRGGCHFDQVLSGGPQAEGYYYGNVTLAVVATDADGVPRPYAISGRCEFRVNGTAVFLPPTASGIGVAANRYSTLFFAEPGSDLQLCEVVTVDGEEHDACRAFPGPVTPIPPQDVIDAVDGVFVDYVDPIVCPVLGGDNELYNCPPY